MDAIRQKILDCRRISSSDDKLIEELNKHARDHGPVVFQVTFHILAGLELSLESGAELWREVVDHRRTMSEALGRKIDLIPALSDLLSFSDHPLLNPRLIEEESYAKVIMETTHDGLTSLFNRNYFDEVLEQTVLAAKRYHTDLSLLFLDIDDFKEINDTYGHAFGDEILQQVATIINRETRDSDIAARFGGEEFVVLMPHTENMNAFFLAERIRKEIENHFLEEKTGIFGITISGGLASYPQNCENAAELLRRADSALYLAKGSGKNCISAYKVEKRRYLRVTYKERVQVKELGFDPSPVFSATSKDICIGGILFENNEPLPIGARIQVNLPIEGSKPVLLIGTVVRVEAFGDKRFDIGMTLSFKEMEKIASTKIANFLQGNME